jgi:type IV pilus assembly protein PilA
MFQRFHEKLQEREGGFTLIELLVVILIIAILAAIAIPVFLNQREKGWRSQVQSALKNGATAVESYATSTGGNYSAAAVAALKTDEGLRYSSDVTLVFGTGEPTANTYCFEATHTNLATTEVWSYDSAVGEPVEASC